MRDIFHTHIYIHLILWTKSLSAHHEKKHKNKDDVMTETKSVWIAMPFPFQIR